MRKSEWSDEQLEKLLREMPRIEDKRDPRDIYQNISLKMAKKKQRSWIIPSVATAAAVLILAVLTPNLFSGNFSSESSMESRSVSEQADQAEMNMMVEDKQEQEQDNHVEEKIEIASEDKVVEEGSEISTDDGIDEVYTALYDEDVADENVFIFAIPDREGQNIVPITVLVPKEKGKSLFEQYVDTMPKLLENEWGLKEYFPLKDVELSVDEDGILKVNIPSGQTLQGSSNEIAFTSALKRTAKTLGLNGIELYTDDQPGIEMGNSGNLQTLDLSEDANFAYYFYYSGTNSRTPYLVPYGGTFNNVESALDAMKENVNTHQLEASIPENLEIEEVHSEDKEMLTLQLKEKSEVSDTPTILQTIEAILLTAKEFDFEKVKIEYNNLESIGKFTFNKEINVPVAPNKMDLLN
ncbi:GerMN domain-containing protein [Robertmurraya massiliosenegalensis]|uniref:GerMN domain-containing protein n=1 Tax=Robertmurraya massiliosenegalensis TaxID=1287657 RepID=UPI0002F32079|nr:GerMN domain-containing protein [Robertmurraya massiliosenegalensis]